MAREYFHVYHSYLESMQRLSMEERGRLFTALLCHSTGAEIPKLGVADGILFDTFSQTIDRERKVYEEKCRKMKENADKRWGNNAAASKSMQEEDKYKNENENEDKYEDEDKDEYKDEEKDKDEGENISPFYSPAGEKHFRNREANLSERKDLLLMTLRSRPSPRL